MTRVMAPVGIWAKIVCGVVYPAQVQPEEHADDEFVVVVGEYLGDAADPEPQAVADHAACGVSVEGVQSVQGRGMAQPDDRTVEEDVGDAVWKKPEDQRPFAVSEVREAKADQGCEHGSARVCKGQSAKCEVALELHFGGEGGCSEPVEYPQYGEGQGDFVIGFADVVRRVGFCVAEVGIECAGEFKHLVRVKCQCQSEERADAARTDAEHKMRGGEFVDAVVFVQQRVVQAKVADGNGEGEEGIGRADGAKIFGDEELIEKEEDDKVDDPRGIGAPEGLNRAPHNALNGRGRVPALRLIWHCRLLHGVCECTARWRR